MKKNEEAPFDLESRTKQFSLRIIRLYSSLPKSTVAQVIGRQLMRSGTSVGAHYRESRRNRSSAEFISKLEVGLQELEETKYWMELLHESKISSIEKMKGLLEETDELTSISVTCVKTAKSKRKH